MPGPRRSGLRGAASIRARPSRSLPAFLADLVADRRAAGALLASTVALFAAGLDPKIMAPTAMTNQAAIRANPQIEVQALLISVTTAILLLVGGAIGDTSRTRPTIAGGLLVSFVAAFLAALWQGTGLPFELVRLDGIASAAFVMPCALALAATSCTGVARATTIGIAYAGYGAGQGLSPMLGSLVAWIALGGGKTLSTVYDLRDEGQADAIAS